ncbi:MAG: site-2 protease family protein [Clostridia bacterium]|nr:site-2 protease family protein [Clostridia bacterium]
MNYLFLASFGSVMTYVGYILLAILVLLVMITVHEFGHYITGRIFGFGIEEFAIGFGPRLFSKTKKNGEKFSIRLFPIGGFCSFRGEDDDSTDPTAFNNKKPWQRLIVLVSGALMNYIFAVIVIIIMFSVYGHSALMTYDLTPDPSVPIEYSFQSQDVIVEADGKNIYLVTDLMDAVEGREKGELVEFTVIRDGKVQDISIMLREDTHFKNVEDMKKLYSALGVYYAVDDNGEFAGGGIYSTGIKLGPLRTVGRSFEYSFKTAGTIFTVLRQLFTGSLGISSLGGTVTTITVTADAIRLGGFQYLLNMTAFIGVNLAVFNLLPIPALDGSRAVFTTIEWIRKKPLKRRVEAIIHGIGFVLILLFAIFVDVQQCF